jgi:hypothetical protein
LADIKNSSLKTVRRSARDLLQQSVGIEDARVHEPIENGTSVSAALDESGGTEDGEVLAHVGDLAADRSRKLADALLAARQPLHDAQSLRVGQGSGDRRSSNARRFARLQGLHRR